MADFGRIRAVLFDIGGTLLDFEVPESRVQLRAGIAAAYDHLAAQGVRLPDRAHYQRLIERRFIRDYLWTRPFWRELDPLAGLRAVHNALAIDLDADAMTEVSRRCYGPTMAIAHAAPGAVKTLAQLIQRGYVVGAVSNTMAPPAGLDDHLRVEGLLEHLPLRVYSCQVGVRKPHRRIFETALRQAGVPAVDSLYVGDKPRIDVRGARRVGMMTAWRNANGQPARGPRADLTVTRVDELLDVLPSRGDS